MANAAKAKKHQRHSLAGLPLPHLPPNNFVLAQQLVQFPLSVLSELAILADLFQRGDEHFGRLVVAVFDELVNFLGVLRSRVAKVVCSVKTFSES